MTIKCDGKTAAKIMSLQHQVTAWKSVAKKLAAKLGRLQAKQFIQGLRS
jgi:hypothetical protein